MGPKGAVEILYKGEGEGGGGATEEREAEYREKFAHPYLAAARGYLDDIIDPRDTRPRLIDALATLETKRDKNPPKKHGNLRSEEHTSELQSPCNLVCRLLLEKKKTSNARPHD